MTIHKFSEHSSPQKMKPYKSYGKKMPSPSTPLTPRKKRKHKSYH